MSQDPLKLPANLELPMFSKHVGEDFRILVGDEFRTARLLEAVGHKTRKADASAPLNAFSLLFHDPEATVRSFLEQGIYRLEHSELGLLDLFMVPVGPLEQTTGICYEAVFNSCPF